MVDQGCDKIICSFFSICHEFSNSKKKVKISSSLMKFE